MIPNTNSKATEGDEYPSCQNSLLMFYTDVYARKECMFYAYLIDHDVHKVESRPEIEAYLMIAYT